MPSRYHHYLDDRILVSSWYPEADQLELLRAVSFLLPGTPDPWMSGELKLSLEEPGRAVAVLRGSPASSTARPIAPGA